MIKFEFRAFAPRFDVIAKTMRSASSGGAYSEITDTYFVTNQATNQNVKVRNNFLEVKQLLQRRDSLECWEQASSDKLPLPREIMEAVVLPALDLGNVKLVHSEYHFEDLLSAIVHRHRWVASAVVHKRRNQFTIDHCTAEMCEVVMDGAMIHSVAVESEDPDRVREVLTELGLLKYENVNYPKAIRRMLGIEPQRDKLPTA